MFIRLRFTFGVFDCDFVFDLIDLDLVGADGLRDFDRDRDFGFVMSYDASFSRFLTFLMFIWARTFLALRGVLDRLLLPTYFISDFFCLAGYAFLILLAFLELLLLFELLREPLLMLRRNFFDELCRFFALLLLLHELLLALCRLEELLIFLALLLISLLLVLRFSFELLLRNSCCEEMFGGD